MAGYSTPGVYYERVDAGASRVLPLRTDIAGLVGIARRGPIDIAVPIDSWRQFTAWFGDVTGAGYLAYAARGFFELEMFTDAWTELEEIEPAKRHMAKVILLRVLILNNLEKWESAAIIALKHLSAAEAQR